MLPVDQIWHVIGSDGSFSGGRWPFHNVKFGSSSKHPVHSCRYTRMSCFMHNTPTLIGCPFEDIEQCI